MTLRIKHTLSSHDSFKHFFLHVRDSYSKSFVFPCSLGSDLRTLILGTVVLLTKRARVLVWTLHTPETSAEWWGGVGFGLILMLSLFSFMCINPP